MKIFNCHILLMFTICALIGCRQEESPTVQSILHTMVAKSKTLVVEPDTLYAQTPLRQLYKNTEYAPVWAAYSTNPINFDHLLHLIETADRYGLNPNDYHLQRFKNYRQKLQLIYSKKNVIKPSDKAVMDLLLSDAFLTMASHQFMGRVHSQKMNQDWNHHFSKWDLPTFLLNAIMSDSLSAALLSLQPSYQQYHYLQKLLESNITKSELTTSQKDKIIRSMERWRWLPKSVNNTFISVNIPEFLLRLHRHDSIALKSKVIVGTLDSQTPTFNDEITHLIIHPRWNVPSSIVEKEILPKIRRDTSYLVRNHFRVLSTWSENDTSFVDPETIAWDSVTIESFPYRIIQTSGPWNPLGQLKFMFPNPFEVYLHDTPNRWLFEEKERTFSHGCIRVAKATELAVRVTGNDSIWSPSLYFAENEKFFLEEITPVFINYWTAWVEGEQPRFMPDIYKQDSLLKIQMSKRPGRF